VYVALTYDRQIAVIDPHGTTVSHTIQLSRSPLDIAIAW
jgi:YVTN family beta-propeller protein